MGIGTPSSPIRDDSISPIPVSAHGTTTPKTRTNYTDQLLEELTANNNRLVKANESGPRAVNWASRISAARQSGKIPHSQELRGKQTYSGYEIELVDIPAWRLTELTPITTPARLTKPHAVVAALQKRPRGMGLTKSVHNRALRLIQALVTDAESKGHTTALGPTPDTPPPRHRRQAAPHFTITAQVESIDVLVLQEHDHSKHIPTDKERAHAEKHTWMRIPRYDYTPANRLRFILRGGTPHHGNEWADLDGHPLEDQLAEIAQEVDLRGEAAEQLRLADEQAQEAARQNRESTLHNAHAAYAHAYRVEELEKQAAAWHEAKRLAEFVTAVREQAASLPPGQGRTEIEEWLAFADAHLQELTKAASAPRLPSPPAPSSTDLKPYLATLRPLANDDSRSPQGQEAKDPRTRTDEPSVNFSGP
ncbi:hypothetical protein SLNWT_1385 [Streptomyces albus]|uniref:PE-PGRS family protein n=1 Tax=Streptomyces albus (strain ATCC 21838 / DSM 41398 / FERM P-419 / JCM 4703 / NBRC 107858) TaxID=1081613 RepID=A0A0B5ESQ8_STRA4|nr:hypothetical protein SLNWT_1385 [Streptomyces albus]AOU76078.1 hypothetical protein SLNHY_1387 [Streptomyces albus]AYN31871.1 hypothetical protein DUI70_1368 [Streptomyces albus]